MGEPVLITGTSSGIGYQTALLLAKKDYHVYATVRDDLAAAKLRAADPRICPVHLDVRDTAQVEDAVKRIEADHGYLTGLVSNAGIIKICPLEIMPEAEQREILDINFLGPVRMIQHFLPLLRAGRGRIINVGSLESRWPSASAALYTACKAALRAMGDVAGIELRPWGIKVVTVDPGFIKTEMIDKAKTAMSERRRAVPDELAPYRAFLDPSWIEKWYPLGTKPERTARCIERALVAENPRPHYYVGPDAHGAAFARWLLPERWTNAMIALASGVPNPTKAQALTAAALGSQGVGR